MKSTLKNKAGDAMKPLGRLLSHLGVDPRGLAALRHYPSYRAQYRRFRDLGGIVTHRFPILTDYDAEAGSARGHYFHQDLLVASLIHEKSPVRHIDIGSRIDGFVAHVAAFRRIEVMDIRGLEDVGHRNIFFLKADLMDEAGIQSGITDSISCLHAIEHFGLGRYGDPLDPAGHLKGFGNIVRMLKPGGTAYLSFPIGRANEVHFNAHRVFHPRDIFNWAPGDARLRLARFDYVDDQGGLHRNFNLESAEPDVSYGCGIYTFEKLR